MSAVTLKACLDQIQGPAEGLHLHHSKKGWEIVEGRFWDAKMIPDLFSEVSVLEKGDRVEVIEKINQLFPGAFKNLEGSIDKFATEMGKMTVSEVKNWAQDEGLFVIQNMKNFSPEVQKEKEKIAEIALRTSKDLPSLWPHIKKLGLADFKFDNGESFKGIVVDKIAFNLRNISDLGKLQNCEGLDSDILSEIIRRLMFTYAVKVKDHNPEFKDEFCYEIVYSSLGDNILNMLDNDDKEQFLDRIAEFKIST